MAAPQLILELIGRDTLQSIRTNTDAIGQYNSTKNPLRNAFIEFITNNGKRPEIRRNPSDINTVYDLYVKTGAIDLGLIGSGDDGNALEGDTGLESFVIAEELRNERNSFSQGEFKALVTRSTEQSRVGAARALLKAATNDKYIEAGGKSNFLETNERFYLRNR